MERASGRDRFDLVAHHRPLHLARAWGAKEIGVGYCVVYVIRGAEEHVEQIAGELLNVVLHNDGFL